MDNICTHLQMNLDVPKFTRCCICLPLRRSLIAWGYLKLIVVSLLLIYFSNSLWDYTVLFITWTDTYFIGHILKLSAIVSVLTTEIILNVFLVLGAHKKQLKLLKIYYFCSIFLLILKLLLNLADFVAIVCSKWPHLKELAMSILNSKIPLCAVDLILQMYVLLLVRSEIMKLNIDVSCRFINNDEQNENTPSDCNNEETVLNDMNEVKTTEFVNNND